MIKKLSASQGAFVYVTLVCLLWALVPTLLFPNPPLDVVEGYAWGREMALGYTKHPPMQAWLLEASYWLTGGHTFGGYWLSAISAGLGYLAIWKLARRNSIPPEGAFWAIVLTSITFYFTLPLPEFNPNILQIPVWAWMILLFHRGIERGNLLNWILLGAVAAFGLYTKYFVLLLIGAIGLYTLVFAHARRKLLTPGPWLAALTCLVLLISHGWWLLKTDFLTLQYAASRSKPASDLLDHVIKPLEFLGAQLGNHATLFVVVIAGLGLAGLRRMGPRIGTDSADNKNDRTFLLWFAFVPLGVVLLAGLITGNEFEHMWGTPMFVLSGILAVYFLKIPGSFRHQHAALRIALAVQAVFLLVVVAQAALEPQWKDKQTRMHYPGKEVADALAGIWKRQAGTDLPYVAGDMWSAANVTIHASERPSMFYLHDVTLSPWIDLEDVQRKGLMIVWRGDRETPLDELLVFYPDAKREGSIDVPYGGWGLIPPVKVNWLIIPPGSVAKQPVEQKTPVRK
ncbi:glycosyltransferase family 39 protein [Roseibium sp. RKSG952]|uniref:glycosyltransferase family 39 protein n=1 Tax=Roseibium sp. RKSG952 TaxID=2529384 RepID=UPI0012BD2EFB|nr:glycosyltransferase family 39 protein [Roseibium sp. RKSG952]MTH99266.1 glycosyltransferase family 39 protein [Roseibium sp. RKSG952]